MTTIEMQQYQQQHISRLGCCNTHTQHTRLFSGQQYGTLHALNCPCLGSLVACRARIYIEIYSIEIRILNVPLHGHGHILRAFTSINDRYRGHRRRPESELHISIACHICVWSLVDRSVSIDYMDGDCGQPCNWRLKMHRCARFDHHLCESSAFAIMVTSLAAHPMPWSEMVSARNSM